MRLRVTDAEAARDLSEFLQARVGAIVEARAPGEFEVSLLGSFGEDALRQEVEAAVRQWRLVRRQPDGVVKLV